MGLDITVYTKAVPLDPGDLPRSPEGEIDYDECWNKGYVHAFVFAGFEQSFAGLPEGTYEESGEYTFAGNAWMDTSGGDSWGFRAGSYGGYNRFRERLCQIALGVDPGVVWKDPDAYRDKPFFELINFADNEGTIGPVAAAELAKDFDAMGEEVRAAMDDPSDPHNWHVEVFADWSKACHDAANTGLINFH